MARTYIVPLPSGGRVRMRYLDLGTFQRIRKECYTQARDTPALAPSLTAERLAEASLVEVDAETAGNLGIQGDSAPGGFVALSDASATRRAVYSGLDSKDRDMIDVAYARKNALTQEEAGPLLDQIVDEE